MLKLVMAWRKAKQQVKKFGWWLLESAQALAVGIFYVVTWPFKTAYNYALEPLTIVCCNPGGVVYVCKETCLGCCDGCFLCCHPFADQGLEGGGGYGMGAGAALDDRVVLGD
jgi:hypothetical protein